MGVNTWDLLLAGSIICSIVVTNNVWKISHEFDDAMSQHDGADDELTLAQLDHSRCEDKDAVQLRRQARDMETQMLEMKGSRNESLSVAIAATDVCQTALEVVTRRDEGVTQELEQTRRDLQQAQIQAKRALLRNESAAALSNMTGDPVELFLKDSDDELRNTMIMKLSIALEVEISDLQELSSTELLKRAKKHLATDRAAECEDLAPEVMQHALVEFREEAQLDINDDVSSMCYVEVRNALIDEVHSRDGRDIAGIQALTDDELVADAIRLLREGALPREENTR